MQTSRSQNLLIRLRNSPTLRSELSDTFRLATPLMLGELSSMLMGVVGTMMVGRLGESALAASGIAGVVYAISMLLVWGGIRMIPTPVAEAHELRDGVRARTLIGAGGALYAFFLAAGALMLLAGIRHFDLLQQDPQVSALAVRYLYIVVYSLPATILFAILVNYCDAFGYVRLTMVISFGGLALDILLNWIFIFGRFGAPAMGIEAIAMNTGISHAAMSLALLWILLRKPDMGYIKAARASWQAIGSQALTFIRYGIPSALQIAVEFAAFGSGTVIIGWISKTEQAAHQIALNLASATYVTIMGISTAGMIRVGQALAYKSRVRVWLAGIACIASALLVMGCFALVFLFAPGPVVAAYTDDPKVTSVAVSLLFFAGLFQLADAAQASSISLLRSLNDVVWPSVISLGAFWVIGVPLGYWLAMRQGWHAQGVWMGYLVALIIQAALFLQRFFALTRKM